MMSAERHDSRGAESRRKRTGSETRFRATHMERGILVVNLVMILVVIPTGIAGGLSSAVGAVPYSRSVVAHTLPRSPPDARLGEGAAQVRDTVPVDPRAFLDSTALAVYTAARRRQARSDSSIASYEAIRRQRLAMELRTPLRDRTVYHAEAATRIWWSPDGVVEQYLASSETTPDGRAPPGQLVSMDDIFDPTAPPESRRTGAGDRGSEGEDGESEEESEEDVDFSVAVRAEDFLAPGAEARYRFRTTDSLVIGLPDGRSLRAVAVEAVPRERSGRLGSGVVWIEPESGAVVRSVSRLSTAFDFEDEGIFDDVPELRWVPGMFRPIQFDVSLVVVEYSLWDFRHWMRRRVRVEGAVRAGVVTLPATLEVTYQILDVTEASSGESEDTSPGDGAARVREVAERWQREGRYGDFRIMDDDASEGSSGEEVPRDDTGPGEGEDGAPERVRVVLAPVDSTRLHDPEWLPPPAWEEAPGFVGEEAREEFEGVLEGLRVPPRGAGPLRFSWGYQGPDLLRYNRVEGLSVGARIGWRPPALAGPLETNLTGRLGVGTWVSDGRLDLRWTWPGRMVSMAGYHAVTSVDPGARSLGPGNSLAALVVGRDDGDYYRATGASVTLEPGPLERAWYEVALSAEEHRPLPVETDFSVFGGADPFRPALQAERVREYLLGLRVAPYWGSDPRGVQGGVEILLQGAAGDRRWGRSAVTGRLAVPLLSDLRAGLEVAGGQAWGDPPLQRSWFLGGTRTLRGYAGAAAVGRTFGRARVDLSRGTSAGRLSLFGDAGWAGDRSAFEEDDILLSAGVGMSVLEGLVRVDLARALREPRGWRLEVHLDSFQ